MKKTRSWIIVPLDTEKHDRKRFDCGEPVLNNYLQKIAKQHAKRNISRTYVTVIEDELKTIIGFYTLSSAQLTFTELPTTLSKKLSPHYPIPVARLGRLAVDYRFQGQGMGESLLINALYRCAKAAQDIGIAGVIVDAKNEKVSKFYHRYDFVPLTNNPLTLILPMKTIMDLFENKANH